MSESWSSSSVCFSILDFNMSSSVVILDSSCSTLAKSWANFSLSGTAPVVDYIQDSISCYDACHKFHHVKLSNPLPLQPFTFNSIHIQINLLYTYQIFSCNIKIFIRAINCPIAVYRNTKTTAHPKVNEIEYFKTNGTTNGSYHVPVNWLPPANPDAVCSDLDISVSLKARSSFILESSCGVGKWPNRWRFWNICYYDVKIKCYKKGCGLTRHDELFSFMWHISKSLRPDTYHQCGIKGFLISQ